MSAATLDTGPPGPKRKRRLPQRRSQEFGLLLADYHLIAALQAPLEFVFWVLTQRKAKLADKLENRGFNV